MGFGVKTFLADGKSKEVVVDPANVSHHRFLMETAFAHEDEGTAEPLPANVKNVMAKANEVYPGVITAHNLARGTKKILTTKGFDCANRTVLASSFCCDEVNRDFEDEFRAIFGNNFHLGGIAGFPFGGATSFGAFLHHIPPKDGFGLILYGPHVGIDWDGVVGKVNRKGHEGSGACCNTAIGAMYYVQAVEAGRTLLRTPDPSDPIDAQQVFVNSALLEHKERLSKTADPHAELPHALLECQKVLMERILEKCAEDIPKGTTLALMGGIQVNTPEGTPEYFLPKSFDILGDGGAVKEDLLASLVEECANDPKEQMMARLAARKAQKEAEERGQKNSDFAKSQVTYG